MIRVYQNPTPKTREELLMRPALESVKLDDTVMEILNDVKENGNNSLLSYASKFDGVELDYINVSDKEIQTASISKELEEAIKLAKSNIEKFHSKQIIEEPVVETIEGVKCWRKSVPIEKVGLYIPGGSAPLFSTVLMLGVPAMLAGCEEVILCTPPDKEGKIDPAILFTAQLIGIKKLFKVGGAQAIAAMAFGTETIPRVNKIFGPGNQFVTKAKEIVQRYGIAIDMPAGPSEVLVIADNLANPSFVAADLLSQAEHGEDSQVVLLSDSEDTVKKINSELYEQLAQLPRKKIAVKALENSFAIVLNTLDECIDLSNQYAPEHLIINTRDNDDLANKVANAGSVFIGSYSCESAGDYASGTNHTLPTNGFAKSYSGLSVESFQKKITYQEINAIGLNNIGPAIELMAEAEQLYAHKNAVTLRLKEINNG